MNHLNPAPRRPLLPLHLRKPNPHRAHH
jgi:hypothetical protein